MRVPIEWLKEYVDLDGIDQSSFLEGMILSGSNLERAFNPTNGVTNVVVGKITKITRHPDADKLNVCTIDAGSSEPLQIITAATNVGEGKIIPVFLVGAVTASGDKIKKGKLRGMDSFGMLCSFSELGFEERVIPHEFSDGILLLDPEFEDSIGRNAIEALGMSHDTIEFEITPNRPDCLSIVGIAREAAATFGRKLKYSEKNLSEVFKVSNSLGMLGVKISSKFCDRYIALSLERANVRRSPFWLGLRLMNAGIRPINNIVDITNYINIELGQPIHAFDRSKIVGDIEIRQAKDGEEVVTLDGEKRVLTSEDLLITDSEKPLAIAGVMGLLNSEITEDTTEVVFEIAAFDKSAIRATSKRLGLRSESSSRFEKGISVNAPELAAVRIAELVKQLGAGVMSPSACDVHGERFDELSAQFKVPFDEEYIRDLIGVEVDAHAELAKLGIAVNADNEALIPHYRLDLRIKVDLVEEVARMYGYDRLPCTDLKHSESGRIAPMQKLQLAAADAMVGMGIDEILTYSFISPAREQEVLGHSGSLRLLNPLGEEYSVMRTSLLPNMLDVVGRNIRRKNEEIAFFEIGRIYDAEKNEEGLPCEMDMLCSALCRKNDDFYTAKGTVEVLLASLGYSNYSFEREDVVSYLHPGRAARIFVGDVLVGRFGELHPVLAAKEGLKNIYIIEISFDWLLSVGEGEIVYSPVSMYPAVERDAAFIVEEAITSGDIEDAIRKSAKGLLEEVKLFDVYRDSKLGEGKKSMAYSMKFRTDRTLAEDEVEKLFRKAIKAVEFNCGAVLRDS